MSELCCYNLKSMDKLKHKSLLLTIFLSVISIATSGQHTWGIGILTPPDSLYCGGGCEAMENAHRVPLYNNNTKLSSWDSLRLDGFYYSCVNKNNEHYALERIYLECEAAISAFYPVFYHEDDSFIKVRFQSILHDTQHEKWIWKKDLVDAGFMIKSYPEFFATYKMPWSEKLLTYHVKASELNLHKSPDKSSSILVKMPKVTSEKNLPVFEVNPVGERKGSWIKVKVTVYNKSKCGELNPDSVIVLGNYTGWINISLNNNLGPPIWINNCCISD